MNVEALEVRLMALEGEVRNLKDIEAIKRLQRAYGYYVEHMMGQEIIDCFSTGPDVYLEWLEGRYEGQEGLHRYFGRARDNFSHEMMHQVIQMSGIVTVDPDGINARGRWYAHGAVAVPAGNGVGQMWMNSVYEMEYVKEDGVWKIKGIRWNLNYTAPPGQGWVKPERLATGEPDRKAFRVTPDIFFDRNPQYPSGYIPPFHFKHPVTGKETSEAKRNATIDWEKHKQDWRS